MKFQFDVLKLKIECELNFNINQSSIRINKLRIDNTSISCQCIPFHYSKIAISSSKLFSQADLGTGFRNFKGIIVRESYQTRVNGLARERASYERDSFERPERFHSPLEIVLFHNTESNNSQSNHADSCTN